MTTDADGWIKHNGNGMPVDGETEVLVRFRDGTESRIPYSASEWRWGEDNGGTITHYRIVYAAKPAAVATKVTDATPTIRDQCAMAALTAAEPGKANHKLDTDRQVFFYEQEFYVLSNFSAFQVDWAGRPFQTAEHLYHWLKFVTGWDLTDARGVDAEPIATLIYKARSAHNAFKIAEANRHLRRPDWDDVKVHFMRKVIRNKVLQHEYVRRKLLATGDRELIEDSWRDDFWGWGPNRDGQNMLGKLWMELRDDLRSAALVSEKEAE